MTASTLISPRQLAQAIGASESSLKRWADDGLIQVSKTAGGHRRIRVTEAIRFIRDRRIAVVKPSAIGLSPSLAMADESTSEKASIEHFTELLTSNEPQRAETYLEARYLAGDSVASLGDNLIRSALATIGEIWKHRSDGIMLEHRATDSCLRALIRIRMLFDPEPDAPKAIGGAIPNDDYLIPPLLASIVAAECGFQATNLGPNNPFPTIRHAVDELEPPLIWIATSKVEEPMATAEGIHELAAHVAMFSGVLAVGGRELDVIDIKEGPFLKKCDSMVAFEQLAQAIKASNSA